MSYRPIIISSHLVIISSHHDIISSHHVTILTCVLDIYLDTISLNNYSQIDYDLNL